MSELEHALTVLKRYLKDDKYYRQTWVDNISSAYIDTEYQYSQKNDKRYLTNKDKYKIANTAATQFISVLTGEIFN